MGVAGSCQFKHQHQRRPRLQGDLGQRPESRGSQAGAGPGREEHVQTPKMGAPFLGSQGVEETGCL